MWGPGNKCRGLKSMQNHNKSLCVNVPAGFCKLNTKKNQNIDKGEFEQILPYLNTFGQLSSFNYFIPNLLGFYAIPYLL